MGNREGESTEIRKFKDAVLIEIFIAYRELGTVYQKATDPETRQTLLDLKRCYDLAIHHLSPGAFTRRNSGKNWGCGFRAGTPARLPMADA
ncbi:MAG: hypothetical protein ACLQAH_06765 [Limisphaerales bacterium]